MSSAIQVPLLDLKPQYASIKQEIDQAIASVCESQYFILGPEVEALEAEIADYCGAAYAVGVSSGTDALLISLMAAGIGSGDEVITSPYTFFATAGAIHRLGAKPVFVDIEPKGYNIASELIAEAVTKKTKAIIPVHLYGQCAEMNEILEIAKEHGLIVIEDAAQAIGAGYTGQRAGSIGDFGCFSFFPSKNLGAFGDGGIVTTNNPEFAEKLKVLRVHGMEPKYYHPMIGGNFRLDALQAAVVRVKLRYLDSWSDARNENSATYRGFFDDANLTEKITLPTEFSGRRHVYNQFVIKTERRDELKAFLQSKDIGCDIYYPVPLHLQECFQFLGYSEGDFPESEEAANSTLALPIYPELSDEQIGYVVSAIADFIS